MGVEPDDAVIAVQLADGQGQVFLGTKEGMAIRFPESDVRPMGRTAYGVRGISLRGDDSVVAMEVIPAASEASVMTVCENGYGKRTLLDEYRVQSRGGVGIISIHTTDRNGRVVGIACVTGDDELMLITQQGKVLRMPTSGTRPIGRATQGVRLIEIESDDRVVSVVRLAERDDEQNDGQDEETPTAEPR
jgi:DNA gyrase subunit A